MINGGFEAEWEGSHECRIIPKEDPPYFADVGNHFVPTGWVSWFYHDPGNYDQPECGDTPKWVDEHRVRTGERAFKLFTFHRRHDAGLYQQVQTTIGANLRLTAYAHAWSNHQGDEFPHANDPRWSEGAGYDGLFILEGDAPPLNGDPQNDALGNFTFYVGIDPTGGIDPFADTVVWGQGAHIYNVYHQVPEAEVKAQAETITIFLRSKTLWKFKHNDAYWDDVTLEVVGDEPIEPSIWDYPVIEKGSKVGIHAIAPGEALNFATVAAERGTPFSVVKAVDGLGLLREIKTVSPETITIGRVSFPGESLGLPELQGDLHELAEQMMYRTIEKLQYHKDDVDYWEVTNESDPVGTEGWRLLGELNILMMDIAEANDIKIGILASCAGTPEWDEMVALVETGVFGRAKRGGHILTLHEGVFGDDDIDKWWGDLIPGSPVVEGAGALCFRYRYLYYLLKQRDEVIPLVVSEIVYGGGYEQDDITPAEVAERVSWYDSEAAKDYYMWGHCPFTVGPTSGWEDQNYSWTYPAILDTMLAVKDRHNALPEQSEPGRGDPRIQYERTYVLLPPEANAAWAEAVVDSTWDAHRYTFGGSADDAGIGNLDYRAIIAINPEMWNGDLREFYVEHYPGVLYQEVFAHSPVELVVKLLDKRQGGIALSQRDPRWTDLPLGELVSGETIGQQGCVLTSLAMMFRDILGTGVTPPVLNKWLAKAEIAYSYDDLIAWTQTISLFPHIFSDSYKSDRNFTMSELRNLYENNYKIILRICTATHFVYLNRIEDGQLYIIDPWDGQEKLWNVGNVCGVRAAKLITGEPPIVSPALLGFNDPRDGTGEDSALNWLINNTEQSVLCLPIFVDDAPQFLDFAEAEANGVRVIVNLRYSWSTDFGGQGTLPPPDRRVRFIASCSETMAPYDPILRRGSRGVWGWTIGNETNNPREWPRNYELTPEYVATVYNEIYSRTDVCLAPGAVDPFFGPGSDNREWFKYIWEHISGAHFVPVHGYIRGPNPALLDSEEQFSHDPLKWQYLNFPRCCETLLLTLPDWARGLDAYVTEFNHLWRTVEPDWGWVNDIRAKEVILAAMSAIETVPQIKGLAVYRWRGDDWDTYNNEYVLDAVRTGAN